jgi:oligopeptide/dipeptide ABC transporter ATP-binding protein
LLNLPKGCPFAARCIYRKERCLEEKPPLLPADDADHLVACWYWEEITNGQ